MNNYKICIGDDDECVGFAKIAVAPDSSANGILMIDVQFLTSIFMSGLPGIITQKCPLQFKMHNRDQLKTLKNVWLTSMRPTYHTSEGRCFINECKFEFELTEYKTIAQES